MWALHGACIWRDIGCTSYEMPSLVKLRYWRAVGKTTYKVGFANKGLSKALSSLEVSTGIGGCVQEVVPDQSIILTTYLACNEIKIEHLFLPSDLNPYSWNRILFKRF